MFVLGQEVLRAVSRLGLVGKDGNIGGHGVFVGALKEVSEDVWARAVSAG